LHVCSALKRRCLNTPIYTSFLQPLAEDTVLQSGRPYEHFTRVITPLLDSSTGEVKALKHSSPCNTSVGQILHMSRLTTWCISIRNQPCGLKITGIQYPVDMLWGSDVSTTVQIDIKRQQYTTKHTRCCTKQSNLTTYSVVVR
jgi:hypothetical protein